MILSTLPAFSQLSFSKFFLTISEILDFEDIKMTKLIREMTKKIGNERTVCVCVGGSLQWRNLANTAFAGFTLVISYVDSMNSLYGLMRMTLDLCSLPAKNYNLSLTMKTIRQTQSEGHSANYLTSTVQDCQGTKKKESLRNSQPRVALGDMTAKCVVCPGWDLGTERGQQEKLMKSE